MASQVAAMGVATAWFHRCGRLPSLDTVNSPAAFEQTARLPMTTIYA